MAKGNVGCHDADVVNDVVARALGRKRKGPDVAGKRELRKSVDECVEKRLHVGAAIGRAASPRQRSQVFD